jgi:Fe2+ transport system protein B
LALAGNKNDMYEHEEVEENEGKELAKELGAIFQKTSAKESTGVEDLFLKIGKKFINPNAKDSSNSTGGKVENQQKGQKLKNNAAKSEGGKKGCC